MNMHGTKRDREFNADKALASIAYLVEHSAGSGAGPADLYSVMKMLYLADKAHLAKYGRTVTGDDFAALEKGPVPEGAYALCKFVSGRKAYFEAMPDARERVALNGNDFCFLKKPNYDALSVSDMRALDEALSVYAAGGWQAVANESHDEAWKAAWASAQAKGAGSIAMTMETIVASLPNAAVLMEYLSDPHPGTAENCPV